VKLGAENRTKLIAAISLMVIAVVVLLLNSGSPAPKAAAFVPPNPTLTPVGSSRPAGAARSRRLEG